MKNLIIFLCLATMLASCSFVARHFLGFQAPKPIAREEIIESASRLGIPPDKNLFLCADYFYDYLLIRDPSPSRWIRLFSKNGERVNYHGENFKESCPGKIEGFIHVFAPGTDYAMFKESQSLQQEAANWCSTEGNRYANFNVSDADLYVVVTWAKFMSLNRTRKRIKSLREEIAKRPDLKIDVIYVNIDPIIGNPNKYYERIITEKIMASKESSK